MRKYQPNHAFRPPQTAAASRGGMDSLVQGSLVDLFSAYNVAVAPRPRAPGLVSPTLPDMAASVGFSRQANGRRQGKLSLALPSALLESMSPGGHGALNQDWVREMANQLMGRLKNRLLPFNVRLEVGVSSSIESTKLSQQLEMSRDIRIYTGRALRGEVVVVLEGAPEDSELSYIGPVNVAAEGAAILF